MFPKGFGGFPMVSTAVIHSILTAISLILCALAVWASWRTVHLMQRAEALAAVIDSYEPRIDSLERGSDRFADSLARLNGRIGAMIAKEQRAARLDDTQPIDREPGNPEREGLLRTLAARAR